MFDDFVRDDDDWEAVLYLRPLTACLPLRNLGLDSVSANVLQTRGHLVSAASRRGRRAGLAADRETLWLLWRFDFPKREWIEAARASARDWTWSVTLRPMARRLLNPEPVEIDCAAIAKRINEDIVRELDQLSNESQGVLLSALESHLDARISRLL
jgi:hypothetical protein